MISYICYQASLVRRHLLWSLYVISGIHCSIPDLSQREAPRQNSSQTKGRKKGRRWRSSRLPRDALRFSRKATEMFSSNIREELLHKAWSSWNYEWQNYLFLIVIETWTKATQLSNSNLLWSSCLFCAYTFCMIVYCFVRSLFLRLNLHCSKSVQSMFLHTLVTNNAVPYKLMILLWDKFL